MDCWNGHTHNSDQTIGVLSNLVLAAIEFYKFTATAASRQRGGEDTDYQPNNQCLLNRPFSAGSTDKNSAPMSNGLRRYLGF